MRRMIVPIAVMAVLAGCTNDWPVEARAAGDAIEFVSTGKAGASACTEYIRIDRGREQTMWEIDGTRVNGGSGACAPFPIRYGTAPTGFATKVAPTPLTPGLYAVLGSGGYRGAFRYAGPGKPIVNYAPNSPEWCTAHYPGSSPDWLGQCVIDSANKSQ